MTRTRLISFAAIFPFLCGPLIAKDYKVGTCIFALSESPQWRVISSDEQTITVAYKYVSNKKKHSANMQISCVDKKLEDALGDDFKQSSSGLAFLGSSGGEAPVAKEVRGADWHGWQVKYFQNNVCLLTVGSSNRSRSSSFRSEVCDNEDAIEPQIAPVKNILQNLFSY